MKVVCKPSPEVIEAWGRSQGKQKVIKVCSPCPPAGSTFVKPASTGVLKPSLERVPSGGHGVETLDGSFLSSRPWGSIFYADSFFTH